MNEIACSDSDSTTKMVNWHNSFKNAYLVTYQWVLPKYTGKNSFPFNFRWKAFFARNMIRFYEFWKLAKLENFLVKIIWRRILKNVGFLKLRNLNLQKFCHQKLNEKQLVRDGRVGVLQNYWGQGRPIRGD